MASFPRFRGGVLLHGPAACREGSMKNGFVRALAGVRRVFIHRVLCEGAMKNGFVRALSAVGSASTGIVIRTSRAMIVRDIFGASRPIAMSDKKRSFGANINTAFMRCYPSGDIEARWPGRGDRREPAMLNSGFQPRLPPSPPNRSSPFARHGAVILDVGRRQNIHSRVRNGRPQNR